MNGELRRLRGFKLKGYDAGNILSDGQAVETIVCGGMKDHDETKSGGNVSWMPKAPSFIPERFGMKSTSKPPS
jgi:hypothetical protein